MKYLELMLVVTTAMVAGQVLTSKQTRGFDEKFREFLEKSRITVQNGNSSMGIPQMDPFKNESMKLHINETYIGGTIELSDFNVTGLAGYVINTAKIVIAPPKMMVALDWPVLKSAGSYDMNVVAFEDFKLYGSGNYTVTLENLSFVTSVWIKLSGGVSIKKMETEVSLGSIVFSATGLFNDEEMSEIMSAVISDAGPELIQECQKEITTTINDLVTKKVNPYLEGKSLKDILAILG